MREDTYRNSRPEPSTRKGSGPFICHWHLKNRLYEFLRKASVPAGDQLYDALEHAFRSPADWSSFEARAATEAASARPRFRSLTNWLRRNSARTAWQIANQYSAEVSTGPLEQHLSAIRGMFDDRRGMFGNRERMNRLLSLILLHQNGKADERIHSSIIRTELLRRGGRSAPRRQILDRLGHPSLRP